MGDHDGAELWFDVYWRCWQWEKLYGACIANSLTNQGYTVKMTNFIKIRNDIFSAADKNAYVEKLCDYDLLILVILVQREIRTIR